MLIYVTADQKLEEISDQDGCFVVVFATSQLNPTPPKLDANRLIIYTKEVSSWQIWRDLLFYLQEIIEPLNNIRIHARYAVLIAGAPYNQSNELSRSEQTRSYFKNATSSIDICPKVMRKLCRMFNYRCTFNYYNTQKLELSTVTALIDSLIGNIAPSS